MNDISISLNFYFVLSLNFSSIWMLTCWTKKVITNNKPAKDQHVNVVIVSMSACWCIDLKHLWIWVQPHKAAIVPMDLFLNFVPSDFSPLVSSKQF